MMWKAIHNFDNLYSVSENGEVMNNKTGKILKSSPGGTSPYLMLRLTKNNKQHSFLVHRLVAIAFIDNPNNLPTVNHINGDKLDNKAINLEWASYSDQNNHAYKNNLKQYRPLHYKGKFGHEHNRSKAVFILETNEKYGSMSEAARNKNIAISSVHWSVKNNKPIYGMHFQLAKL